MKNVKSYLFVAVFTLLCSYASAENEGARSGVSLDTVSQLEQNFSSADVLSLSSLPIEALDSSFFDFIPTVDYGDLMEASDSTTFTTAYQPSDSYWASHCNEEDVYLARMKHTAGADDSWDLRIGKGGQIYSFIGPYGEGVPPSNNEKSRWNDEVWQPVSVCTDLNNGDSIGAKSMKYYIHGAGNYINEETQTGTFYSPLMASWYNESEKAFYVNNWGQHAHVPSIHKSGILYTTKYKDIGEGVLEVTYVVQNFGTDTQNHLNVPWGGVRSSNLRGQFLSMPDQSIKVNMKQTGSTGSGNYDVDETGGFFIFANDTVSPTSPSMGIVFGDDIRTDDLSNHNLSNIYFRHAQVGGDSNPRDYSLFVVIPKLEVKPGEIFYYRVYYINGNRDFVHEKSKELVPFVEYGFIESATDETPMVSIHTDKIDGALTQDINLFASPVINNVPLFLMEKTATGEQYISPDLYYNVSTEAFTNPYVFGDSKYATYIDRYVNRPYDGAVKYIKLLGYGVEKESITSTKINYGLLDTMIVDGAKIVLTSDYVNRILVPLSFRENWKESDDEDDGLIAYHNFYDEWIVDYKSSVALTYTDGVANPDITAGHADPYVGKIVRGEATHANMCFTLPDNIDVSLQSTISLKVYFESANAVLPENCKVSAVLRNSETGGTNQLLKTQQITAVNQWETLTFDISSAPDRGTHDQIWLFFSMSDATGETTGQVFYIDDLRGPAFYINSYSAYTSVTKDSVIIDLSDNGVDLTEVSDPFFRLKRINGGEDIDIMAITFDADYIYLELDSNANVTYIDDLELSLFAGQISDEKAKVLPYFNELEVRNGNTISFSVVDAKTQEALSAVSVEINNTTLITSAEGELSFKMPDGEFDFTLSKPYYHDYTSSLDIISNIDSSFEMSVLQAEIQIVVKEGTSTIIPTEATLNGVTLQADADGAIRYENLDVLTNYDYDVKFEGYDDFSGTLYLLTDTTIELTVKSVSGLSSLNESVMRIFPNPAKDFITIETEKEMARVEFINIDGLSLGSQTSSGKFLRLELNATYQSLIFVHVVFKDGSRTTQKLRVISGKTEL